ncbi:uncharacterized protein LOC143942906 isoform X2 [Lithobates pipiens]
MPLIYFLLISGDNSNTNNIGYLLITSQQPTPNSTIQLACIARTSLDKGHVTWNISGTRHTGRRTSTKLLDGTWTLLNLLTLPRDSWNYGNNVTCEVWFSSSRIEIHGTIPHRGVKNKSFGACYSWLSSVITIALLLVGAAYVHLTWMKRKSVNTSQKLNACRSWDFKDEGEIVYAELNPHILSENQV